MNYNDNDFRYHLGFNACEPGAARFGPHFSQEIERNAEDGGGCECFTHAIEKFKYLTPYFLGYAKNSEPE